MRFRARAALTMAVLACGACKKSGSSLADPSIARIGLLTDVGGRGDQSFNDGALRGLEAWAAGKRYTTHGYQTLSAADLAKSIPADLASAGIVPMRVEPVILQAKQQEDYEPNLELLVEDKVQLAVAVGFMLENAVEAAAKKNPSARFLLIDSPILDEKGVPYSLPNVRTVTFREQEGAFLVGALAGLVTRTNTVGFVGGMQIPLIRKFEVGFRAGLSTTNPEAGRKILVGYTGTFDKVEAGKQVAQDMISKDADVLFHAAGSDGLGVIAAARESGRWVIGCDSDQHDVAPNVVLTSFIKHVDLAVYRTVADVVSGTFTAGHLEIGLKEGGVGYAPLRSERLGNRAALNERVEALRAMIVSGRLRVPATLEELGRFERPAGP